MNPPEFDKISQRLIDTHWSRLSKEYDVLLRCGFLFDELTTVVVLDPDGHPIGLPVVMPKLVRLESYDW